MKFTKVIIVLTIIVSILGYNKQVFSWGLFEIFKDQSFSSESLKKVENFNPDKDILYLPKISDKNIFDSVNDLSISRIKDVRKYIYIYLTSGRKYTIRAIQNSYKYKNLVNRIFDKEKEIPKDLALLPLLESGFNPFAISRSKAVGLWQFMKNTSKPLGLKTNKWIDERKNIEKSTKAAIRHLKGLHKMFNSWELALAAYNGGGGLIRRSLKSTRTNDLWKLRASKKLNKETDEYVPRFLALLTIYKNQRLFGIKDEIEKPELIETENYKLKKPVYIRTISKLTGVSIKTLKRLNPQIKRHITPPCIKSFKINIPIETGQLLDKNLKRLYRNKISFVRYKVKIKFSFYELCRYIKHNS